MHCHENTKTVLMIKHQVLPYIAKKKKVGKIKKNKGLCTFLFITKFLAAAFSLMLL